MALCCPFWRFFKANVALCHSETIGPLAVDAPRPPIKVAMLGQGVEPSVFGPFIDMQSYPCCVFYCLNVMLAMVNIDRNRSNGKSITERDIWS